MTDYNFKKGERLKSRKTIELLFSKGQSFSQYPLRLVWTKTDSPPSPYPVQFTVSVSKRRFPRAVRRNRIKRQLREAYRLNKPLLYEGLDKEENQFAFMIIYTGKEALPTKDIQKAMKKCILKFLKIWQTKDDSTNPS